ncbi:MAG: PEP-CTERM sorting domain-containing protein [Salinisphaera sp.]|jgi:hypothetical protein|nr:PEP-CTERM sorting domain-containing protein [Salinisphaera sp.]
MRLSTICLPVFLATVTVGIAHANIVTNGDFSAVSGGISAPTQFGSGYSAGNFITGWTGNNGYEIWYPNATAASTVNAAGQYSGSGKEKLYGTISAPPSGSAFVGLDGDSTIANVQASIRQTLTGLTAGDLYNVSFDWGGTQLQSRSGATTEYLTVSLGSNSQNTQVLNNASGGFTGWFSHTFQFVADSSSSVLNFLSVGTPGGLPPVAVLTNVSVTHAVPEPSSLGLFGLGLLGLGWAARRRLGGRG